MKSSRITSASAALLALSISPALAQAPAPAKPDEIVVTALKREQSIQDVAASVTALGASDLAASGVTSSFDLQQLVPGLAISFGNRETNVAIRGVSNNVRSVGSDPSNAVHLDGVYLPQSSMILTDLFDVERVEVLKGPQGTLYGRNATGGAINVISRAPEEGYGFEGFVGAGSFNLKRAQGAVNLGGKTVAARLAASYVEDDGFTTNVLKGNKLDAQDFLALRGQVRFQLSAKADLTLMAQTGRDDGTVGYGISTDATFKKFPDNFYGLVVPANLQRIDGRKIRLDSPVFSKRDADIYGATLNWTIGGIGLKAITGASKYDASDALDYDFTGDFNETFASTTEVKSVSQEIQIFNANPGKLDWTLGLFLYKDEGSQFINWFAPGPFARANTESDGEARAVFGQATYHFSDKWSALIGGRFNHEEKSGVATNLLAATTRRVSADFDSFTPQAQIQYRPNADVMAYFGVTKGFKSGGFNLLASG
ncbi:MAG: TonB-dependent receptor, partial [Caulobacterales bacterium]